MTQPRNMATDHAAALRDAERQIADARHHVQQRVMDLERQALVHERDAQALVTQMRPGAAAAHLLQSANATDTARELRHVLDLL